MGKVVNPEIPALAPDELRAFCMRHRVSRAEIGRRLGYSGTYVSRVLLSDMNGKSVSEEQVRRVQNAATAIMVGRETLVRGG